MNIFSYFSDVQGHTYALQGQICKNHILRSIYLIQMQGKSYYLQNSQKQPSETYFTKSVSRHAQ